MVFPNVGSPALAPQNPFTAGGAGSNPNTSIGFLNSFSPGGPTGGSFGPGFGGSSSPFGSGQTPQMNTGANGFVPQSNPFGGGLGVQDAALAQLLGSQGPSGPGGFGGGQQNPLTQLFGNPGTQNGFGGQQNPLAQFPGSGSSQGNGSQNGFDGRPHPFAQLFGGGNTQGGPGNPQAGGNIPFGGLGNGTDRRAQLIAALLGGQQPGQTPGQTPGQIPGQIPGQLPGQTPGTGVTPGQVPGQPPSQTPGQDPLVGGNLNLNSNNGNMIGNTFNINNFNFLVALMNPAAAQQSPGGAPNPLSPAGTPSTGNPMEQLLKDAQGAANPMVQTPPQTGGTAQGNQDNSLMRELVQVFTKILNSMDNKGDATVQDKEGTATPQYQAPVTPAAQDTTPAPLPSEVPPSPPAPAPAY
jgi:hypothetical protein